MKETKKSSFLLILLMTFKPPAPTHKQNQRSISHQNPHDPIQLFYRNFYKRQILWDAEHLVRGRKREHNSRRRSNGKTSLHVDIFGDGERLVILPLHYSM